MNADTIVAAATPPGTGGVGIVRLSGPDALTITTQLCGGGLTHRGTRMLGDLIGQPAEGGETKRLEFRATLGNCNRHRSS